MVNVRFLSLEETRKFQMRTEDEVLPKGQEENVHAILMDGYMSDVPGYSGPVVILLGTGDPSLHSVHAWDDRKQCWTTVRQDPSMYRG